MSRDGELRLLAELADATRSERSRLADALHDDVLQLVAVARQDVLEAIELGEPANQDLVALLGEVQDNLRRVISSSDDVALDDLPLEDAIRRLGAGMTARSQIAMSVEVDEAVEGVHDAAVVGWVRELLANTVKHAGASRVVVVVRGAGDTLEIVVRDDGRGFDRERARKAREGGHMGLRRLERAAAMLGGHFGIDRDGDETVARVSISRAALVQQRRTEDELGSERRWSASLVAAIHDPFLVVRDDRVSQINEPLQDLTGHRSRDLVGTRIGELPFWDRVGPRADVRRLRRLLGPGGGEAVVAMRRADGSTFNAHWTAQWIGDGLGGGLGTLIVLRDLTEQEQAVEETQVRSELSATIETTRRLADVLDAARSGWEPMCASLGDLLTGHLGWIDVVINVRRGHEWVVEWTSSSEASVLLGERYSDEDFAPLLQPQFDRDGVFVTLEEDEIPVDGLTVVVGPRDAMDSDRVRADDTWLLPVHDRAGAPRAIISVDRPQSGLRPTTTQLQALAAIASHIGLAFELLDSTP